MNFLLDTNVISEWTKPQPDIHVIEWLASVDEDRVFLSVITLAEIRYGIERMSAGTRRNSLSEWLENELPQRFEARILTVDASVADVCGRIMYRKTRRGKVPTVADSILAATAQVYHLALVSRNIKDFEGLDLTLLNPWTEHWK
jgi:predicted nucleic acid-binding protein